MIGYYLKIKILLFIMVLIGSCERRPLEDEYFDMALIPISIDWSKSGIPHEEDGSYQIHRVSVLLFPEEGGEPLEYLLESDISHREIEVPMGRYSVIIFNETRNTGDWSNIYFTGTDNYKTFAAYANLEEKIGFYTKADESTLRKQPEPLAAWSLEHFEVTPEMVRHTRASEQSRDVSTAGNSTRALSNVVPLPRSKNVQIKVRVVNLASAIQATGIVKGAVTGIMMASGEPIQEFASHAVLLSGRQMEENMKDGTVGAMMYIFGIKEDETYTFQTDFLLTDGRLYSPPPTVTSDLFKPQEEDENVDYLIDIGIGSPEIPEPDFPPIILPDTDTKADVEVGSWDEIIIPMN